MPVTIQPTSPKARFDPSLTATKVSVTKFSPSDRTRIGRIERIKNKQQKSVNPAHLRSSPEDEYSRGEKLKILTKNQPGAANRRFRGGESRAA